MTSKIIEEQKELARILADLLARLHPAESPLLRLQLAHWLARRVMESRVRQGYFETSACTPSDPGPPTIAEPDYQI